MLYSMHKANMLRMEYEQETGEVYDYVIVIRPDIMPLVGLDITIYKERI